MSDKPRNDAAMAEILASMRRIVSEGEGRRHPGERDDDILVLTPEMRVDGGPHRAAAAPPVRAMAPSTPVAPATVAAPAADPAVAPPVATRAAPEPAPQQPARPTAQAAEERALADEAQAMLPGAPDPSLDEAAVADIVRAVLREEFAGAFGRNLTQQIRTLIQAEVTRQMAAREK